MKKIVGIFILLTQFIYPQTSMAATYFSGHNRIALQWIGWDYLGTISSSEQNGDGSWTIYGVQKSRVNNDYLKLEGVVNQFEPRKLIFQGTITTSVSYINNGRPCVRSGDFEFVAAPGKKYWRMQQMQNPCDNVTDYVDIFF